MTCELLCEVFEREGFAARFAQSEESALEALSDQRPDVLITLMARARSAPSSPSTAAKSATDDLNRLFAGFPTIDEIERRYLLYVLEATGGNRKRTAEILGVNRRTLYRMAERFQIELDMAR